MNMNFMHSHRNIIALFSTHAYFHKYLYQSIKFCKIFLGLISFLYQKLRITDKSNSICHVNEITIESISLWQIEILHMECNKMALASNLSLSFKPIVEFILR